MLNFAGCSIDDYMANRDEVCLETLADMDNGDGTYKCSCGSDFKYGDGATL